MYFSLRAKSLTWLYLFYHGCRRDLELCVFVLEGLGLGVVCSCVGVFRKWFCILCLIILISYEAISENAEFVFDLNIYGVHTFNSVNFGD